MSSMENDVPEAEENDELGVDTNQLPFTESIDTLNMQNLNELLDAISAWKPTQPIPKYVHKQDLLAFNIINFDEPHYVTLQYREQNLNLTGCNSLDNYYNEHGHRYNYIIKKLIKTFLKQNYKEKTNLFNDKDQSEGDYIVQFIAPIYDALFGGIEEIKKQWGEIVVASSRIDGKLSILDEGSVFCSFSVLEVSDPWYKTDNNHKRQDMVKIAKNLKYMLNQIAEMNMNGGHNISKIKLYGLQVYKKTFTVYSIQLVSKQIYLYKKEMEFTYPTAPLLFPAQLPTFFRNLLQFRSLIESSLKSILVYFESSHDHDDNDLVHSSSNSPTIRNLQV